MWPRTLDMTVDECRVVMRKLELDTYSSVISTFRAQGVLTQQKLTILSELRSLLNIDQDRHRAETRRATNDEELTTIADKLFGDDCIIQWTREGKRGAPLLYRSKPYTTITITANVAAEYVRRMNRKLPDPTMVRRRGEPHDETTSIKSNLILADPLRSAPLHRPTSIAPQLQTIPAAVYRNASTVVAETASHCAGGKSETKAAFKNKRGAAAAARRQEQVPSKLLAKAVPIGKTFATSSRRPATLKKSPQKRKNAAETPNHRRGASKQVGGGGRKRKADESPEIPPDIDHPSHHRLPPPLMLLLQDHVPPPQIAKSKRDISSNCQKLTQNAPPTQGIRRQSSVENAPRKPSQLKFVPIKGLATITSSVSSSSSNNSHPPPSKVQIIDPTILSPSEDVPDSAKGSILFQHLQRKVAPKPTASSSTSSSKENGSTYHGNKQTHDNPGSHGLNVKRTAGLSREETRIQTIGNGHRGERHAVLGVSKSDGLVESIIFNEEVEDLEQEIILEEIVEEEEVVLCEINDSAEIIEEEVCELDYVSMEEPIEVYDEEDLKGPSNGTTEDEQETAEGVHLQNGTDFEYLLDTTTTTTTTGNSNIQIMEVDANGYSKIRKALMLAGQLQE